MAKGENVLNCFLDLPSVVSDKKVAFFDPQENCFEKGGAGHTLSASAKYPDQFAPYNVFGWSMADLSYKGTLFRFPLRSNGDESDLSESVHSPESIRATLFEPFKKDAHLVPLFLKCVESIKLFDWRPESDSPVEVFSVSIKEESRQAVRDARARINVGVENGNVLVEERFEAVVTCRDEFQVLSNQKWLIVHHISKEHLDILKLSKELHQLPWIGLAFAIPPLTAQSQDPGRMFCFLPLPPSDSSNTGLPVHVHGSFSVADNRGSLKWPAADCETDKEAKWNTLLLEHLVASAYEALISKAISLSLDPGTVYRAWPEPSLVIKCHWKDVVNRVLRRLLRKDVFWTDSGDGSWISLEEAVVNKSPELNADEKAAYEDLIRIGEPIVLPPRNVLSGLYHADACSRPFNSQFLCSLLKKSSYKYVDFSRKTKLSLLAFALRDEVYADLVGLFLLPVNDGSFVAFESSSSPTKVFVENKKIPLSLFSGTDIRFLDCTLGEPLRQKLTSDQCCKALSLIHLQNCHVPLLLKSILNSYWPSKEEKSILPWSDQPSRQWMEDVWEWLGFHQKYDEFVGCFVVPCEKFTSVAKLVRKGIVLFARHHSVLPDEMSENVASAFRSAGCVVLQGCPDYILSNKELTNYVWTQTKALSCLAEGPVSLSSFQNWTNIQCEEVLSFLSCVIKSCSSLTSEMETAVRSMPIFCLYRSRAYTSLQECRSFVPDFIRKDLPLKASLLLFPNQEQLTILRHLSPSSYETFTLEEIFTKVVFPDFETYGMGDKTALIEFLLDHHRSLPDVVNKGLTELSFVPVADGTIRKPSQLFNPNTSLVSKLFRNKPVFPCGHFAPSEKYGHLLSVVAGYRSLKSISGVELVNIAHEASAGDADKGVALLNLLSRKEEWVKNRLLERVPPLFGAAISSTVAQLLKRINWCPVQCDAPTSYPSAMPWKAGGCKTALPSETVCTFRGNGVAVENLPFLVGSTKFVLKEGLLQDECLLNVLGLRQPNLDSVCEHWLNAMKNFKLKKDICPKEFDYMMRTLLSLLPQYWSVASLQDAFTRYFSHFDFVWINNVDGFVSADRLALSCFNDLSLEPWLFSIREVDRSHLSSSEIQSALGIKSDFSQSDVLNVLARMKKSHDEGQATTKVARDLGIAIGILNWITEDVVDKVSSQLLDQILVPLNYPGELRLVPLSTDVVYCDARCGSTTDFNVIHENVPRSTVIKLGVSSLNRFLDRELKKKHLDDYAVDLGEDFGQQEPLSRRLANIIEAYPWGVQILKELVQNADDAGASVLHIVYDKRYHPTEAVFCDGWKHLQGPALLAYNDRSFSKDDIVGIQNLGLGSKRDDAAKTGQFGIGFNAVYHLTDCPSFISDNKDFCVFDPLCKFILGSSIRKPGRRFNLIEGFWEGYSDVRDSYYSVFSADQLSGGTLFRFPLRHKDYSPAEPICKKGVSCIEMESLLEEFSEISSSLLLFLNSLTTIKLSVIDDKGRIERFSVSAELHLTAMQKREDMFTKISAAKKMKTFSVPWFKVAYEMKIVETKEEHLHSTEFYHVLQSIGNQSLCNGQLSDYSEKAVLPRAGIAASVLDYELKADGGKAYCFLPLPGRIPLPVCVNGHFALESSRCGLFQSSSAGARNLNQTWNEDLIDCCIAPAYAAFLEEATRYVNPTAFDSDFGRVHSRLAWFHSLFPVVKDDDILYWNRLASKVYGFLIEWESPVLAYVDCLLPCEQQLLKNFASFSGEELMALPSLDRAAVDAGFVVNDRYPLQPTLEWLSLGPVKQKDVHFSKALYWSLKDVELRIGEYGSVVLKALLLLLGLPVVTATEKICLSLQSVGDSGLEMASPESICKFLYQFDLPSCPCKLELGEIKATLFKAPEVVSFLLNFLFVCDGWSLSLQKLEGLPLSVTGDERLKVFSEQNPIYISCHSELFPAKSDLFMHPHIRDSTFIHFRWSSIIEITQTICLLSPPAFVATLGNAELFPDYMQHAALATLSSPDKWIFKFWEYITTEGVACSSSFEDAIACFKVFPVIPATSSSQSILVPVKHGYTVVQVTDSYSPIIAEAEKAVTQMGMPVLRRELLSDIAINALVKWQLVTFDSPRRVIKALQFLTSNSESLLNTSVSLCLLKYFNLLVDFVDSSSCKSPGLSQNELSDLAALSLFETVSGEFQPIIHQRCVCLPFDLLLRGSEKWMKSTSTLFLKSQSNLSSLYKRLGVIDTLHVEDIYVSFILPKFHLLSDDDRMEHLLFLKSFCQVPKILETLKQTPCFFKGGDVRCVNSLYDPDVELFSLMLDDQYFPRMPTAAEESVENYRAEWLEFLRKFGLRKVALPNLLLELAERLERTGRKFSILPQSWIEKSKCLFHHFIVNDYEGCIRENYSSFKCLPAAKIRSNLEVICEPFSATITSCELSVKYSDANERICWTSCSLAPKWTESPSAKSLSYIKVSPSLEQVVDNVRRYIVGYETAKFRQKVDQCLSNEMEQITLCTMQYFSENVRLQRLPILSVSSNLSDFSIFKKCFTNKAKLKTVKELWGLNFIFIKEANAFVTPLKVVRRSPKELLHLHPYFYELPDMYGMHINLLRCLGVDAEARPFHCACVLREVYRKNDKCNSSLNNSNDFVIEDSKEVKFKDLKDIRIAMSAIECLFRLLQRNESEINNESLTVALSPLFLLNRKRGLEPSSNLVFLDDVRHEEYVPLLHRSKTFRSNSFLIDLTACNLSFLHEKTVDLLPERLQPRKASTLFGFRIRKESIVAPLNEQHLTSLERLKNLMTSQNFVFGLKSIYVHKTRNEAIPLYLEEGLKTIAQLNVRCLSSFSTCLVWFDDQKEVENTSENGNVYLEVSETGNEAVLYVTESAIKDHSSEAAFPVWIRIIHCLMQFFRCPADIDSATVIGMLTLKSPLEIPLYLKFIGISFRDFGHERDESRYVEDYCGEEMNTVEIDHDVTDSACDFDERVVCSTAKNTPNYGRVLSKEYKQSDLNDVQDNSLYVIDGGKEDSINVDPSNLDKLMTRETEPHVPDFAPAVESRSARQQLKTFREEESHISTDGQSERTSGSFHYNFSRASSSLGNTMRPFCGGASHYVGSHSEYFLSSQPCSPQPKMGRLFRSQAAADLLAARKQYEAQIQTRSCNFALVCFLCHECAEKALKGVLLLEKGLDVTQRKSHNLLWFRESALAYVSESAKFIVQKSISELNNYYVPTRYPDALDAVPAVSFTQDHARKALESAEIIVRETEASFILKETAV